MKPGDTNEAKWPHVDVLGICDMKIFKATCASILSVKEPLDNTKTTIIC